MSAASEQTRTTAVSASLLFAVIAAFVVLKSARDALFLGVFPVATLPYLLVLNALTSAAVAAAYVRSTASSSASRNIRASLAVFFGCVLLFWLGLHGESRRGILLFYLWVGLFGTLVPVQAWLAASERLSPRQARRTLGFLGAGASLGGSAGGILARACSKAWGATALLPLAAALVLLALAVSLRFERHAAPAPSAGEPAAAPRLSRRFGVLIVTVVAVGSVVSTFVDFQFKAIAQREMTTAAELAALFGSFYASVEVATLVLQVLATPFLLRRLPLSATLPLLPLVLFAGSGMVLAAASLASALFLKASEQVLRQSLDRSSRELLYLPVAPAARARLKSLVETLGVRVPEAAGAVALVLLVSLGDAPLRVLVVLALVLVSIWTVAAVLLGREYPQVLKAAILHREIDFSQARDAILGRDFLGLLPDLIHASSPETLLHLLELMRTTGDSGLGPHLRPLIEHRDPRVRHAALDLLMTQRHDLSKDVERRLSDEDLEVRTEAVHYLCMRCAPGVMGLLDGFLRHPDARVRVAASACALNEPDSPARESAYDRLDEALTLALRQDEPEVRIEIAHVLGRPALGSRAQRLFRRLLKDPDPAVRRAALRSVARASLPGLVPDLLEALADPALRYEAREALRGQGAAALPELKEALHDRQTPLERRKGLVRALGETGDAEVAKQLLDLTQDAEPALAFAAIKALNRLRNRVPLDALRPELERLLDQQVRFLETERQRAQSFAPRPKGLMQRVLTQRAQWAVERVFRVLGLLYDAEGIYDAYQALLGQDSRRRDLALEFLATTLEAGPRSRVLPVLESPKPTAGARDGKERAAVLFGYLKERDALASAAATAELTAEEVVAWRAEIERGIAASGGMLLVEEALRPGYRGLDMSGDTSNPGGHLGTVQKIEQLGRVGLFSGLGAQELLVLAERSEEVVFQPGQTIFREGAAAAEIYSIIAGRVELCREAGQIELLGPGESFGTLAALTREPRFFTACALERSQCLKLHRDTFWEILEAYPRVAHGVIETLVRKVEALTRQAEATKQSPR